MEFVLLTPAERRENLALTFRYQSEDQLVRWREMSFAGQTLELDDGSAGADSDVLNGPEDG